MHYQWWEELKFQFSIKLFSNFFSFSKTQFQFQRWLRRSVTSSLVNFQSFISSFLSSSKMDNWNWKGFPRPRKIERVELFLFSLENLHLDFKINVPKNHFPFYWVFSLWSGDLINVLNKDLDTFVLGKTVCRHKFSITANWI